MGPSELGRHCALLPTLYPHTRRSGGSFSGPESVSPFHRWENQVPDRTGVRLQLLCSSHSVNMLHTMLMQDGVTAGETEAQRRKVTGLAQGHAKSWG